MNKTFTLILIVVALALAGYNVTLLNVEAILEGDSLIACIGILASLCAVVLLLIYHTSKRIADKIN
ncbi:Hypothetical protein I595_1588 [Croceitalea dokdonensis DOKDO 023]|uniref:Uncharacterized protein n=1 Tax=Croceitalea dokdonensis DOKDO 023 TaxID=1300341 RepID=A0A0N8H3Z4_9FLAO|nr:hypothetical protein [Croceitalea dokdonensis]KPM31940.1 Hypothetical protein I595_1588 [Croceitalea dokdonensis DOKDO 023]